MPLGLLALAIGGFGIGLTEFVIMGLLPEVAADFAVSEATAGWLITGYALSVVVGALLVTAAVTRFPRKSVLLALMCLFIVGNLVSALSSSYEMMLLGRVVAALCHGAFFGIGAVVAASLVEPAKKAGAIAMMFAGLTAANVLGVPFGTFLGQNHGWRSTFWAITVIGVVALIGIAALVPRDNGSGEVSNLRRELRAFRSVQVWLSIAVTVLGYGGMFGAFTYIAFTLTDVSGFASSSVPWLLVLFGGGLFVGNYLGGKAADRNLTGSLTILLGALTVVLVFFALTAESRPATIASLVLMGAFGFATVPGLQMRVMSFASDAPTMASGANIAAFNLGNALGAWLGGVTISAGLGYTSPIWAGSGITAAALMVLLFATGLLRRADADPIEGADRPSAATSAAGSST
ncbi:MULTISPECIES: MFS transporter [unclassified Rhodococcus (in: high G+C Gram-positive bacteria)]|uniref:MFS transporter n=1 Tax=unclassified Rhodococcus (in: high G+C Gram-positive bacteria) TaxID=192944 RepID=UPI0007BB88E0|nr:MULTISPECIES: MFS transporter [unclassified Rhodococcus (in: high G+C Gram-positive bacteria)]KZF01583.1 MFS transporter [Rhodococcus sp. EPR-147]KZF02529.1 MFS transporter [Rhodococcus sp. EPR-279]OZE35349.1 MFS transporter [Rhodococcus sp. 05-2254-4]OZE47777.1 MFS transporter [Rhodococcus sp. 05-2254-3]OZE48988.1 MFS transporter [Rhodococcus sp. 05-2254-2]